MTLFESRKEIMPNELNAKLATFAEFAEKMARAGFTPGSFDEFVDKLPSIRYGDPDRGLARKLYLLYIGLAEFSLKPGFIKMFDQNHFSEKEEAEFKDVEYADIVVHTDDQTLFDQMIDIPNMDIMSPLFMGEREITLEEALRRIISPTIKINFASFWHWHWLMYHKEFIPESWREITKSGGRIVFPKVRLIRKRHCELDEKSTCYPHIRAQNGGYEYDFSYSLQANYGGDSYDKVKINKDYFVFFKPRPKENKK